MSLFLLIRHQYDLQRAILFQALRDICTPTFQNLLFGNAEYDNMTNSTILTVVHRLNDDTKRFSFERFLILNRKSVKLSRLWSMLWATNNLATFHPTLYYFSFHEYNNTPCSVFFFRNSSFLVIFIVFFSFFSFDLYLQILPFMQNEFGYLFVLNALLSFVISTGDYQSWQNIFCLNIYHLCYFVI